MVIKKMLDEHGLNPLEKAMIFEHLNLTAEEELKIGPHDSLELAWAIFKKITTTPRMEGCVVCGKQMYTKLPWTKNGSAHAKCMGEHTLRKSEGAFGKFIRDHWNGGIGDPCVWDHNIDAVVDSIHAIQRDGDGHQWSAWLETRWVENQDWGMAVEPYPKENQRILAGHWESGSGSSRCYWIPAWWYNPSEKEYHLKTVTVYIDTHGWGKEEATEDGDISLFSPHSYSRKEASPSFKRLLESLENWAMKNIPTHRVDGYTRPLLADDVKLIILQECQALMQEEPDTHELFA